MLHTITKPVKSLLRSRGFELVPASRLYDWQTAPAPNRNSIGNTSLPPGASDYLRVDHSRLLELRERYARYSVAERTGAPVWTDGYVSGEELLYFRGDNPYRWQLRGMNMHELGYVLSYYAVRATDRLGVVPQLTEDGLFGVHTFPIDGRRVSRDTIDSALELNSLNDYLDLSTRSNVTVFDIGAGYGRLAHAASLLPSIGQYLCTDAVAESSFLCEYYLKFRRVDDRCRMVPLDEVEATLSRTSIDIAVNIHSFSECSLEAIDWWVRLLKKHRVPKIMIVPNMVSSDGMTMQTNDREDFSRILVAHGYQLLANDPKFSDPMVQKYGINPTVHFLYGC
jgi:hypothetical protein